MSFKLKTIIGIALIESLLLAMLVSSSFRFLHDSNAQQLKERMDTTLNIFVDAIKDAVVVTDLASLESTVANIIQNHEIAYIRITDTSNRVLAKGDKANYLAGPRIADADIDTVDDGVYDRIATIQEGGVEFGTLEIGVTTAAIDAVLQQALTWTISIASIQLVLVTLLSYLLGSYLTKHLSNLKAASMNIIDTGPGTQIPVTSNDELGQVAEAFNHMSRQLQDSYKKLTNTLKERDKMLIYAQRHGAKSQAMLNGSQDAIISIDQTGKVIDYNPAAERMFGWRADEILGAILADFVIPPEYRKQHQHGMKRYLETGSSTVLNQRLHLTAMHKRGHRLPIEITMSDTSTPEGILFTAFIRDMTQHENDQTELRLAAAAFETVEPMFITDANATIIRINRAFTSITGYTEDDVIGKTPRLWASGRHDQAFYQAMWASLLQQSSWSGEVYNRRKSGEVFTELLSISSVVDDQGITSHYIAHLSDLTEQQQRQAELEKASLEAKQAEQEKARFLAVMSHEIRTPLNAVIGILEVLNETAANQSQHELLKIGQESSWLLLSIINNILDFSKIEAKKLTLNCHTFDLHSALRKPLELFQFEATKKALNLSLTIADNVPKYVVGDSYRLQQVLNNLISNAVKFTQRGEVTISASTELTPSNVFELRCQVEDTGIGIPNDKFDQLFQEFSIIDHSHVRQNDGSGLGLVICKHLTELMGGQISVHNRAENGCCFSFTVQLGQAPTEKSASLLLPENVSALNARVLVAEDNPANQRVIAAMLASTEISIEIVSNGQEAVTAAQRNHYDLILMDISMPIMDGITAANAIREIHGPQGKVPIIALTAYGLAEDRQRFLAAGMDDYLSKPLKKKDLLNIIQRWKSPSPPSASTADAMKTTPSPLQGYEDEPLVDEYVLQKLIRDTSVEVLPELLSGYIEDGRVRVAKAIQASLAKDCKQLEFEIHSLASSAAFHGNTRLYYHTRAIEELCRNKAYELAMVKIDALEDLAIASFAGLEVWLQQPLAQDNSNAV